MPLYDTPEPTKHCNFCDTTKPATDEYFCRAKNGKYGLASKCNICRQAYRDSHRKEISDYMRGYSARTKEHREEWRDANQEIIKRKKREYRKANQAHIDEYTRQYRAANRERLLRKNREYNAANREHARAYYVANKEHLAQVNREWRAANRELSRSIVRLRRARKRNAGGVHTPADVERQYKAQKGRCYYCKCKVGDTFHVDHVVPLARGGSNGPENIVIACAPCNQSKNSKLPHEWPQGNRLL